MVITEEIYKNIKEVSENSKQKPTVAGMLKRIGLSKSGYYRHKSKGLSKSKERQLKIKDLIMEIWEESQHLYGAPKITAKLRKMGIQISERTVGKYMKELKIRAKYCKPFTVTTRDSNLNNKLKNILDEQFNPEAPDTIWCIDTTYIPTKEGFVYLTSIMDLFSRRIISWDLSTTLETTNIISLINKVKATRKSNPKIIHSDRGS
ncbi:IS3 family transposase [Ligilactobacillus salivarius]|uniref:IS3 family transposase n=1 Tax=Ligilactobacillus salivarius TaxID=1624 RepID=UPI00298CF78F|nr:IS3 family transposase [Ligilactobacillus salivarius]